MEGEGGRTGKLAYSAIIPVTFQIFPLFFLQRRKGFSEGAPTFRPYSNEAGRAGQRPVAGGPFIFFGFLKNILSIPPDSKSQRFSRSGVSVSFRAGSAIAFLLTRLFSAPFFPRIRTRKRSHLQVDVPQLENESDTSRRPRVYSSRQTGCGYRRIANFDGKRLRRLAMPQDQSTMAENITEAPCSSRGRGRGRTSSGDRVPPAEAKRRKLLILLLSLRLSYGFLIQIQGISSSPPPDF